MPSIALRPVRAGARRHGGPAGGVGRRAALLLLAGAAASVAGGACSASPESLRGVLTYEGGVAIPEGRITVFLDDSAKRRSTEDGPAEDGPAEEGGAQKAAAMHLQSDGVAKRIPYALDLPAGLTASPTRQVVVHLERSDGWLIARGAMALTPGRPADLTLHTVLY